MSDVRRCAREELSRRPCADRLDIHTVHHNRAVLECTLETGSIPGIQPRTATGALDLMVTLLQVICDARPDRSSGTENGYAHTGSLDLAPKVGLRRAPAPATPS